MRRLVTLLAVADICLLLEFSTGDRAASSAAADSLFAPAVEAAAALLPFPKDNFHLDGIFEIDALPEPGEERERGTEELRSDRGGNPGLGGMGYGAERILAECGARLASTPSESDDACEWRDVREISRARACDACARVSSVVSCVDGGDVGDRAEVPLPLPLRAPRLRRL